MYNANSPVKQCLMSQKTKESFRDEKVNVEGVQKKKKKNVRLSDFGQTFCCLVSVESILDATPRIIGVNVSVEPEMVLTRKAYTIKHSCVVCERMSRPY